MAALRRIEDIMLQKDGKFFVAGHRGLVGSAICRALRRAGYENLCVRSHAELDLTEQQAVRDFFAAEKPDYVILAAALSTPMPPIRPSSSMRTSRSRTTSSTVPGRTA